MEEFVTVHDPQLKSINFPMCLTNDLFRKVNHEDTKDLGDAFEIRKFENSRSMLVAKQDFDTNSCVYLVDHIWTNDGGKQAFDKLKKSPELTERLGKLFNVPQPTDPEISLDVSKQASVIASLTQSTVEEAEVALKDCECDTIASMMQLSSGEKEEEIEEEKPKKKDKCSFGEFKSAMLSSGQISGNENEAYLEKMYKNFLEGGDGCGTTSQYNWSDDGSTVTVFVPIPETVKKQAIKSILGIKSWKLTVNGLELINGELYATVKPDECFWAIESPGLLSMTLEKVGSENLWAELIQGEVPLSPDMIFSKSWLKERNSSLYLREILDTMWCYNQVYVFMSADGVKKNPVWYIMDEYGSALTHGIDPNFNCSPFFNINTGRTYSLIWPRKNVIKGDICKRNFIPQIMQRETHETYKTRLKAFIGNKIYNDLEIKPPVQEIPCDVKVLDMQNCVTEEKIANSIYAPIYHGELTDNILNELKLDVISSNEEQVDISIFAINDTSIMIDNDSLPTCEMLANTDYVQNYLKFNFDNYRWFDTAYILPHDLEDFCKEFEQSNISCYWIVKQVDKRMSDVGIIVTSSYSRIVRMCEAGPICVSKYIADQPRFRHHRFVLNYSIILDLSDKSIFIYKEPLIRQTKERYEPNALLDEYNTSANITEKPERIVGSQDSESYHDFITAMNKLLLPVNPDKGWDVYQNSIFERIGRLSRTLSRDIVIKKKGKPFVVFGVDVIINDDLNPIIIDINGESNLPSKSSLDNVIRLTTGNNCKEFVKIL